MNGPHDSRPETPDMTQGLGEQETPTTRADGLQLARLHPAQYARHFGDAHPPLTAAQAKLEAERCLYCHAAPCVSACPTEIDVPAFIARIAQGNLRGAAKAILEANPLGAVCARVCPTEVLCEQACVRTRYQQQPVRIGDLQRHATDAWLAAPQPPLFERRPPTGRRVAVVGAGPAGLACAHGLARRGHSVRLLDARDKLGGLNEYGLATYKTAGQLVPREIDWLLSIGGIEVQLGQALGRDVSLEALQDQHDAVFLGLGLQGVHALGLNTPEVAGLMDAVSFIASLRQASDWAAVPVGRRVVVIGGGMTAIDAAVQARMLGAEQVHIVYRRGPEAMSASGAEQAWAQTHGVGFVHWAMPTDLQIEGGLLRGVHLARTRQVQGQLVPTGETLTLAADMVLRAIGQRYLPEAAGPSLAMREGRLLVDAEGRTSRAGVWAGGDACWGGQDLTVEAVAQGKRAAESIDRALQAAQHTAQTQGAQHG